MNRNLSILSALVICLTQITLSQRPLLEPLKPIGLAWATDAWRWMSFVAFNGNGNEVASDGATTPEDVSGELSFWTFPDGRLIRKLPARAGAITEDFKYYANSHSLGDVATGKTLLTLGEPRSQVLPSVMTATTLPNQYGEPIRRFRANRKFACWSFRLSDR